MDIDNIETLNAELETVGKTLLAIMGEIESHHSETDNESNFKNYLHDLLFAQWSHLNRISADIESECRKYYSKEK